MDGVKLSIKAFGIYVVVTGLGLVLAPGLTLGPLGMAVPTEIWIRVLGAVAIVLGYYYWTCGVAGSMPFIQATLRGRMLFAGLCILLIVSFSAPLQLLLFALVDIAGAAWTAAAMRKVRAGSTTS